jgi:hypothetical protein
MLRTTKHTSIETSLRLLSACISKHLLNQGRWVLIHPSPFQSNTKTSTDSRILKLRSIRLAASLLTRWPLTLSNKTQFSTHLCLLLFLTNQGSQLLKTFHHLCKTLSKFPKVNFMMSFSLRLKNSTKSKNFSGPTRTLIESRGYCYHLMSSFYTLSIKKFPRIWRES